MSWDKILMIVLLIIEKVLKDSDEDGRPDILDSAPADPNKK